MGWIACGCFSPVSLLISWHWICFLPVIALIRPDNTSITTTKKEEKHLHLAWEVCKWFKISFRLQGINSFKLFYCCIYASALLPRCIFRSDQPRLLSLYPRPSKMSCKKQRPARARGIWQNETSQSRQRWNMMCGTAASSTRWFVALCCRILWSRPDEC